ncbi:NUDIX domain-containing protein [uncultured Lutibacter sp.]|uniref:NUDIX domain-containing protein n=1 Tax=uncultured Lutibacter sp. TaxID=437739 RepID=UPI00260280CB|nr:NUDIX domain-containing protein [uncultured Lutibacter sp.]
MKKISGAIIINDDKILLVKRSPTDSDMPNLWSLPAGNHKKNEDSKTAVIRELKEETNLICTYSQFLYKLKRSKWEVDIFLIKCENYNYKKDNVEIADINFFGISELPEKIVIDSYIIIQKFSEIIFSKSISYPKLVDQTFSAIFYTHIFPKISSLNFYNNNTPYTIYKFIIETTPYRKFKSVVPFLLSSPLKNNFTIFLLPEFAFAIWTLLDDIVDNKKTRYNQITAPIKFGLNKSVISLFTFRNVITSLFKNKTESKDLDRIIDSIEDSGLILNQRLNNTLDISYEDYIKQSMLRTRFLRESWTGALRQTNLSTNELNTIFLIQEKSAIIGQLINDYFDMTKANYEDFDMRIISSPIIFLKEKVNKKEFNELNSFWNTKCNNNKSNYISLIKKYKIKHVLKEHIINQMSNILSQINNSDLACFQKEILINWHEMSFNDFAPNTEYKFDKTRFLENINTIIEKY